MHLESLEIIGFKSFAAKTVLRFHRGVTAVVGPNGCGKSNILDAIRWVLGEQSAKALRGGEMADVIFSGTDSRQAHNMAEVSLVFGECEKELGVEWNELRITRRIFRDGKSEYLMNGTPCRLKDIHETFMDTGIGRSAYSIMEQGKLDQILSSRPEDRRAIFEEAAGITKFKSQKKEALRKLEYTEANLLRVTDIIKEVKRQIGSLQRQAGKARRYQNSMSELRVLDTHFSYRNYQTLEEKTGELSTSIEKIAEERLVQEETIAAQEQESAGLRQELTRLDLSLEERRDHLQTLRNRIFSGESRVETHRERQSELQAMIARARADRDVFFTRISEQEKEMEQTEAQLVELLQVLSSQEQLLQEGTARCAKAIQERQEAERATDALAHQLHDIENRSADLRGKISVAIGRRDAAEQRLEQLRSQQSGIDQTLVGLTARASAATEAHQKAQETVIAAKEELEVAQSLYESRQLERQQAERDWNSLSKQLAERVSRRELLCQLEREGEGLGEGTQAILRGLDHPDFFQPGILGTLASLITVPSEDIVAVEAALGAASRSVVFKDEEVAQAALKTLKAGAQGRAAVLVAASQQMEEGRGKREEAADSNFSGEAIRWASGLISAAEPVRLLVAKLLEGVAIVDTLETAFRLKRDHPHVAFATRDGEFISRDGVAYGGTDGTVSASALLRRSQITGLERDIASLEQEEIRLATARDASVSAVEEASVRLKEVRESLTHHQMLFSTAQGDERLALRELEETTRRYETLGVEIKTLEGQMEQLEEQRRIHEEQLEGVVVGLTTIREERSLAQTRIASLREVETEATAALSEIRLRVATERQRQQALTQQRGPIEARLRECAQAITARERDITDHEAKIQNLVNESEELASSIDTWKNERAQVEEEITTWVRTRTELQQTVEAVETSLRSLRKNLFDLQDRRSKDEVHLTELRLRMESIRDHISRRYQIDLTTFEPDRYMLLKVMTSQKEKKSSATSGEDTEPSDVSQQSTVNVEAVPAAPAQEMEDGKWKIEEVPWERIESLVAELTERVDAMGPVNIDAIQEYEELEERYTFLEQQNTDLINGKNELLEAIARINKTTRELFATTFERVRLNFQEMFTELFGGGKANLLLADDTDPLESGIEIIARPPGKQLQGISLLSGGERTMTAVALLFAIYMVKPSPFCVLDEMDAPLDESNIGRFIKLLDRFVDQSQFFVITHNKRTMSRADMIYGVTMEEQGVTKLLSVKFHGNEQQGNEESKKELTTKNT
ncbi:MAG: chromosome segregation protein SMC [Chthoniobacterales bacterium]